MLATFKNFLIGISGTACMLAIAACHSGPFANWHGDVEGMPVLSLMRVAKITEQTRSQFPHLSALHLPYQLPEPIPKDQQSKPELALIGQGLPIQPDHLGSKSTPIEVSLYLEKTQYAEGFAEVRAARKPKSVRWPIIAYSLHGQANSQFVYIYLLQPPQQPSCYLVLVGGVHTINKKPYLAFEGTLIFADTAHSLKSWKRGYKINFGYRFPVQPSYLSQAAILNATYPDLEDELKSAQKIEKAIQELNAKARSKQTERTITHTTGTTADTGIDSALLAKRASSWISLDKSLQVYLKRRAQLEQTYAGFVKSNPYLWLDREAKQTHHARFLETAAHDPAIFEMVGHTLPNIAYTQALHQRQAHLKATMQRYQAAQLNP